MKSEDKVIRLDSFLSNKKIESEDDINNLVSDFISLYNSNIDKELTEENAKTSNDFLELAENASSKKKALKYAKKALELDSENLDAEVMIAELSSTSNDALIKKYKKIIDKSTKELTNQGYFDDDNIGQFWLILETRPYMRLLDRYTNALIECMKVHLAIDECKEMLRLCENDNLGARYSLMHLYVYLEDEQSALELYKRYEEEGTQFLLPLSILYYRLGNLTEATKYLKELKNVNEDTNKFFYAIRNNRLIDCLDEFNPFGYRPFTIEEFIAEMNDYGFLFISSSAYFDWGYQKLKSIKD